ncbi:ATP-dependent Clp protease proteolytic subunit [Nonomuraea insulae]|uniref:ATP-dependent Clp protease proteolytic subunit n=1 Tax=Nonomuraea insulae TaxID=1616787 RepID=A0ABW1D8I7_9ACTN
MTDASHAPDGADPRSFAEPPAEQEYTREELLRRRTIVLDERLEHDNADRIANDLRALARHDPLTDVVLLIDSSGGSVQAGLDLITVMDDVSCDVVTYVMGSAEGMALLVLAAGTKGRRHALPYARVMMRRPPDTRVMTPRPPDADEARKFPHDRGVRSARHQVARVAAERTGRTMEQVLADMAAERSFSAEEARAYGVVDEVVDQCKPLTQRHPDRDRDVDGNTMLHHAYFSGNTSVATWLLGLGADPALHNRFGVTPPLMAKVWLAESQLFKLASLVDPGHSWGGSMIGPPSPPSASRRDRTWTNPGAAARLCTLLRRHDPSVYAFALAKAVKRGEPRAILKSAIKIGRPESLVQLEALLDRHGTAEIATDYLNSGSPELADAGREWAYKHFFVISMGYGGGGQSGWGTG